MKKLLTKIIAVVLVLVMVTGMFAGCNSPKEPEGKTKIYFANYAVLEKNYTEFWDKVKVDFEAANPDFEIEYITAPYNDIMTTVTNRVGGGDKVDLIFGEVAWAPELAKAGITSPITDVLSKEFIADFHQNVLETFKYENELYGVPLYFSNTVIFMNKDLLAKVGLDANNPPKTQAELLAWCEKLSGLKTPTGEKIYPFGMPYAEKTAPGSSVNAMVLAFGGKLLDANGKLSIDNKGFDEAVDFYIEMDKKGYNPKNTLPKDLRPMFANEAIAMYIDQTWGFSGVKTVNPKALDFAVSASVPAMGSEGKGSTLTQAHCFLMKDNGGKSVEGTRKLVEFIISKDVLAPYMKNITPAFSATKAMDGVELADVLNGAKAGSLNVEPQLNIAQTNSLHIQLAKMINSICVGGKSKADAIAEFKKQADILLNK
ncbi:MAG: extracellular solute-binding protein [Clostridia bacterium]